MATLARQEVIFPAACLSTIYLEENKLTRFPGKNYYYCFPGHACPLYRPILKKISLPRLPGKKYYFPGHACPLYIWKKQVRHACQARKYYFPWHACLLYIWKKQVCHACQARKYYFSRHTWQLSIQGIHRLELSQPEQRGASLSVSICYKI